MFSRSPINLLRKSIGRFVVALLAWLLAMIAVQAAPPAAGTVIRNQAQASYSQTGSSVVLTTLSNVVEAVVEPVKGISLVQDTQVQSTPGAVVRWPHTLSNTGNVATPVCLQPANLSGDAFDLTDLHLYNDLNGNGVVDAGEPEIAAALNLAVGQSISLILTGRVPDPVASASLARLQVSAQTTACGAAPSSGDVVAQVTDTITIAAVIAPRLEKSANVTQTVPGGLVRYTLRLFPGEGWTPRTLTVDGQARDYILVQDPLPPNTIFADVVQSAGAQVLYQIPGTPADQYQTQAPADLQDVSAIAFGFATLPSAASVDLVFELRMSAQASGQIVNTGYVEGSANGAPGKVSSNPAVVSVPDQPGNLSYRNSTLTQPVTVTGSGMPLNLLSSAGVCNLDSAVAESYPVTLHSRMANDTEGSAGTSYPMLMTETGPNTSVFVIRDIPTASVPPAQPTNNDGVMQVVRNDTVDAVMVCGSHQLTASILIDPAGIVYDSHTGNPIAGAVVSLIEIMPDGSERPAVVKNYDGTPMSNSVTTGADGAFEFPQVPPGNYRYAVQPPNGYSFASRVPVAEQPPNKRLDSRSFGAPFGVGASGPTAKDIPLDPVSLSGLALEKQGARSAVEIGETLRYTLKLRNGTGTDLKNVVIEDLLPVGFAYIAGSARLGDVVLADPVGAPGRKLVFSIGEINSGAILTLSYVVRIAAAASAGDGINQAVARGDVVGAPGVANSNTARFAVEIQKGVFSDEALIVGKIFVDCNRDAVQNSEELGIPGVRLYLDNGNFVVTDSEGKFSFYGITPRTYTLKIDRLTLPAGAEMETVSNRNAGDPQSLFVDLTKGEMHRADFAEGSCTKEILAEVKKRREAGEVMAARVEDPSLVSPLALDRAPGFDPRARPAAGVVGADGKITAEAPLAGAAPPRSRTSPLGEAPLARVPTVKLETLLPSLPDNRFGFLDLKDGDTLPSTDVSVRLAGRDGAVFRLLVNGAEIPGNRVGQKARMPTRQVQAWEYIGVKLKPGANRLRAESLDSFGNLHESADITLVAPGSPGKLQLVLPPNGAVADGQTPARILLRLLDANGVAVTARTLVTLESTAGRWDVQDLDPAQPGVQTFIQGGEALFDLIPLAEPGGADLRASSGVLETTAHIAFNPYLRPLVVSGVIEGAVGFNKLRADALAPVDAKDGFEKDIQRISTGDRDGTQAGVRGSMFLKGKVKGDMLLTLAYDSDKDTHDRLFRDIEPERFYPVYGDASLKGFDAQSTSPLYVRVDKGRSYLLYGDFNTNAEQLRARQLANYSRSLTGPMAHIETEHVVVNLFASNDRRRQQNTEMRAQGISGPYRLPGAGFLRNSEKIDIVVRDRNQPAVVLSTTSMTRFVDYTVDEIAGTILFTRPVAGLDSELNPVFIRVIWESDNGGDTFWVYGADGRYRLTEFLEVGGSVVRDDAPGAGYTLYGVNASLQLAKDSVVTLEGARSEKEAAASGNAWRAEWTQSSGKTDGRVFVSQSDASFSNPNAAISAGRREAGTNLSQRLTDALRVGAQTLYSEDLTTGNRRYGGFGNAEVAVAQGVTLAAGLRVAHNDERPASANPAAESSVTSVNLKTGWNPLFLPKANVSAEYEQDVAQADNRMLGVGGNYQIGDRSRLYARHELISSPDGPFGLSDFNRQQNSTVFGLDYDYMENANAFSEYRVRDAIDGRSAQAAVGLRNGWSLIPGVKLTTQFERVQPIDGISQENTAVAVGVQYIGDPLLKAGTRLEWRWSDTDSSLLNTVALAQKLTRDWSFLGKNTVSRTERSGADDNVTLRDRLRLGLAWRPVDSNRLNWLGLYESRYDSDPANGSRRQAQIVSTHANYQPHRQIVLSGRYAAKYVDEDNYGIKSDYLGQLVSGRAAYDLSEHWDVGLTGGVLFDHDGRQYGLGGEVGYLITSNVWISGGYNFFGYADRDFEGSGYTRQGAYVRLRFKFDEELFGWLE